MSAGRLQQGFFNSDPWANWFKDKLRSFTINSFCCSNSLNSQSVSVPPPSVSSTPGNQGAVYQGQGFGGVGRGDSLS